MTGDAWEGYCLSEDGPVKYKFQYAHKWTHETMFEYETEELKEYFTNQDFSPVTCNDAMKAFNPPGK